MLLCVADLLKTSLQEFGISAPQHASQPQPTVSSAALDLLVTSQEGIALFGQPEACVGGEQQVGQSGQNDVTLQPWQSVSSGQHSSYQHTAQLAASLEDVSHGNDHSSFDRAPTSSSNSSTRSRSDGNHRNSNQAHDVPTEGPRLYQAAGSSRPHHDASMNRSTSSTDSSSSSSRSSGGRHTALLHGSHQHQLISQGVGQHQPDQQQPFSNNPAASMLDDVVSQSSPSAEAGSAEADAQSRQTVAVVPDDDW